MYRVIKEVGVYAEMYPFLFALLLFMGSAQSYADVYDFSQANFGEDCRLIHEREKNVGSRLFFPDRPFIYAYNGNIKHHDETKIKSISLSFIGQYMGYEWNIGYHCDKHYIFIDGGYTKHLKGKQRAVEFYDEIKRLLAFQYGEPLTKSKSELKTCMDWWEDCTVWLDGKKWITLSVDSSWEPNNTWTVAIHVEPDK